MARTAILMMVAGTAIVPVMDAIAKFLVDSMSPIQITWGRFFFQFLIMAIVMLIIKGPKGLKIEKPWVHALRGVQLAIATVFFFWSLQYLPLANAIAIFFVQPMILTMISALVLGESVGWHRRIAVVAGFIGALLIIQPGSDTFSWASFLPLGSALFYASYIATTRAYSNIDHPVAMQFASGLGATIVLTIALLITSTWEGSHFAPSVPTGEQWLWLLAIGFIAAAGHLLVVMGVSRAPASLLAPFGYVEIIAATLLGWMFFDDWPDWLSWVGIAVIVASGIYVFERERRVATA